MKYVSMAIGVIVLIFMLTREQINFFGAVCRVLTIRFVPGPLGGMVEEPFCMNPQLFYAGIVVGILLIAISLIFIAKDALAGQTASPARRISVSYGETSYSQPAPRAAEPSRQIDSAAWKTLLEYDADVKDAAAKISPYGSAAEERLATAYLAVKDKSLLPGIVAKITADYADAHAAKEQAKLAASAERTEAQKANFANREKRALDMMERIRNSGMICKESGKKVATMEMYYGDSQPDHGNAKLVYEDGTVELRAGDSFMAVNRNFT